MKQTSQSNEQIKKLSKGKRNIISRILIEEMTKFKSTKKITTEEFYNLVERLYKLK